MNDSTLLRYATGVYYQAPLPQESDDNYGNPNLKAPKAYHYALGMEKDFRNGSTDGLMWNTGVFYKYLNDLVIPSSSFITKDGKSIRENFNNRGKGEIYGLENSLKYRYQDFNFTLAYTLLKSIRNEPGINTHPSQYDQTHNINLISAYEHGKWTYATRLRYVTGNPYTPITSATYDVDNNVYQHPF